MDAATTIDHDVASERASALYRQHAPSAVRLAFLLTGDAGAAQDIAHDAFLKAVARLGVLESEEKFPAYLRRTVVRCSLMRHRSETRQRQRALKAHGRDTHEGGDIADGVGKRLDIMRALATLPPRQRAMVVLRYWHNMPEIEMARLLKCRQGTVKSGLSRALDSLRRVLPDE